MKHKLAITVCWAAVILFSIAKAAPLMLDIDVSADVIMDQLVPVEDDPGEVCLDTTVLTVKVRESVGGIQDTNLVFELYVIGRMPITGELGVIDIQEGEMELSKENHFSATYVSSAYCIQPSDGLIKDHGEYETYLVVLADSSGSLLEYRCGWSIRKKDVEKIRTLRENARFNGRRRVVHEQDLR